MVAKISGALAPFAGLTLGGDLAVLLAPMFYRPAFNKVSFGQYIRSPAEVGIRRGHIA